MDDIWNNIGMLGALALGALAYRFGGVLGAKLVNHAFDMPAVAPGEGPAILFFLGVLAVAICVVAYFNGLF